MVLAIDPTGQHNKASLKQWSNNNINNNNINFYLLESNPKLSKRIARHAHTANSTNGLQSSLSPPPPPPPLALTLEQRRERERGTHHQQHQHITRHIWLWYKHQAPDNHSPIRSRNTINPTDCDYMSTATINLDFYLELCCYYCIVCRYLFIFVCASVVWHWMANVIGIVWMWMSYSMPFALFIWFANGFARSYVFVRVCVCMCVYAYCAL